MSVCVCARWHSVFSTERLCSTVIVVTAAARGKLVRRIPRRERFYTGGGG